MQEEIKNPEVMNEEASAEEECVCGEAERIILFTTETCPNCKLAVQWLDKAGISFEKLLVSENPDLAKELELKQAPTLVITQDGETVKYAGIAEIKKFIDINK